MKKLSSLTYRKYELGHGYLTYAVDFGNITVGCADGESESSPGEVYIIEYSGHDTSVIIPEQIEGYPVVYICKKAFLSNKVIREVMLPKTVIEIDDFCFARCSKLKKIGLSYNELKLGQSVFLDCESLEEIINVSENILEKKVEDVAYLLAATTGILDAPYLFDLKRAGNMEWFTQWDIRMLSKMEVDDSEGFSKMLLCGEEDYGSNETDPDFYKHLKRLAKCRVAILRLMHDSFLSIDNKEILKSYLLNLIKGCAHEETWEVVFNEHGDDKAYYEFLIELGGVNENNIFLMLDEMGDRHPEMKAYIMKYNEEIHQEMDAFSEFEL